MKLLSLGDNVFDAYLFRGELYPGGNAANHQNLHSDLPSLLSRFEVALVISIAPRYNKLKFIKIIGP